MSKVGKFPVALPAGVTIQQEKKELIVAGPKGTQTVPLPGCISIEITETNVVVTLANELAANGPAYWGLTRALLQNAVSGVSQGFVKELELVGIGYRVEKQGTNLKLAIGYSHPVMVIAPEGITLDAEGNTIKVSGVSRQQVGQVAANIRAIRKPEPYKGKGIKYKGEIIKRKQGKASKA